MLLHALRAPCVARSERRVFLAEALLKGGAVKPTQALFSDVLHVLSVVDMLRECLPLTGGSRGAAGRGG